MSPLVNPDGTITYPTQDEMDRWYIANGIDPAKVRAQNEEQRIIWDNWRANNPNPTASTNGPFYDANGNYIGDPKFRYPNRFQLIGQPKITNPPTTTQNQTTTPTITPPMSLPGITPPPSITTPSNIAGQQPNPVTVPEQFQIGDNWKSPFTRKNPLADNWASLY